VVVVGPDGSFSSFEQHTKNASVALLLLLSEALGPTGMLKMRPLVLRSWREIVEIATAGRMDAALAFAIREAGVLAGMPSYRSTSGSLTPPLWVEETWREHTDRRFEMRRHLEGIVEILNSRGLSPLLVKGASSLWTDEPEWRSMRDLDLVMATPEEAETAQTVLIANGYAEGTEGRHHADFHHAGNLYRNDMPGWIEIHRRAGPRRVEALLASEELLAVATVSPRGQRRALILPPHYDVLFGLVHHYFGHREGRNAAIEIKGLFEFAMGFSALTRAQRSALVDRAARDSRLLATLDVWLAAAADSLGLSDISPLILEADAVTRWKALKKSATRPGKVAALVEELKLALNDRRVRRCRLGANPLGRIRTRFRAILWALGAFGDRLY
jgi:Uncharacterised nucleotidyltransferase